MPELDPIQIRLIQKMTRASVLIEGLKKEHSDQCPHVDPLMYGPCSCGASEHNRLIDQALRILDPISN